MAENIDRPEGAEGTSSNDDTEYELVAEEEIIDTSWESKEVHPVREYPRVAFGRTGRHPEELPRRVFLTDRPTSASSSRSVQTVESPQQSLAQQRPQQQDQGEHEASAMEEQQQGRPPPERRISERLRNLKLKGSRDEPPTERK